MTAEESQFANNLNKITSFLPAQYRKLLFGLLRSCDYYELDFREALRSFDDNPQALPSHLYEDFREAEEEGLFTRIESFFRSG